MTDWIKEAIDQASGNRNTEMEYALLREKTFKRLFPALEKDVFAAIERDVRTYNAHIGADRTRHIVGQGIPPGGSVPLILEKKGVPPFGHLAIHVTEDGREISAMLYRTPLDSGKEEMVYQSYDVKLVGEQLVIEKEGGSHISVSELSRAILEPFFLAVT